ncbi:hypothetical protein OW763_13035 [Clostridium aestuarii]|uniref:Uncharacterized protein n=1 Tax=Clostridium aestuarii TaxID=338193 RepID=A0ABT4D1Y2_9CLOT|nr:hypothetical protein [Clostridium aestuarii]MCY6485265.1 hypothetical protein [Clostridium aestuarii]
MNNNSNLFIRVNYFIDRNNLKEKSTNKAYIRKTDNKGKAKYLIGGGYFNKNGGSFIFKAKDLKEANLIAENNIFVKNRSYKYELIILDEKIQIIQTKNIVKQYS